MVDKDHKYHIPVMVNEVVNNLITDKSGIYVDCTFGGGGHSKKILESLNKTAMLIAFDLDKDSKKNIEKDDRILFINSNFKFIANFLKYYNIKQVDGILADLGVSSHQIDTPQRGFSTRFNGQLDMRMDKNLSNNAYNIINRYDAKTLTKIFNNYGELYNSEKIAEIIVKKRNIKKIKTTFDLKELLLQNLKIKRNYTNKFLAQVFQALRIEVNNELNNLEILLKKSTKLLKPNGRIAIISYHSLEDRIVKQFIKNEDTISSVNKKPIIPSKEEIIVNKRARSAKLRIAKKLNDKKK